MPEVLALETFYNNLPVQPPEVPANETGHFNIFNIDGLYLARKRKITYSRRSFYKITLVTGQSKIHYADKTFDVTDSVLVFTNPMVPYFWELLSENQTGYFCIFTDAFFNRYGSIKDYPVFQSAENAVIPLSSTETAKFTALFEAMNEELQSDYAYKYDLLRSKLMEVIHSTQKMKPASGNISTGSKAAERIATLFAELLERQFPIELSNQTMALKTASDFALKLNVHVNHLNKTLKEITGKTTTQLINERMMQEARMLLKGTTWSIAEIAWCLGFEEANHFSGAFSKACGIAPGKFRKEKID